jgi:hypothetical protein
MSAVDQLYRSSVLYENSPPTTNTLWSNFNYSTAENLYGSNVLLYTGLIPSTNPLSGSGSGDGAKYSVDGIDIIEKLDKQQLNTVEDSFFAFSHPRMTYIIPGFNITLWSKDSSGNYTVIIPQEFYDIFYYENEQRYVIYFNKKYLPIYSNGALDNPSYAPSITCYRYCGPKGIENIPGGTGSQGLQGSSGPQGQIGPTGPGGGGGGGLQGPQGSQGAQGTQGTQGSQGLQGFQGTQGLQGLQGRQGTQGLQGLQGRQGTQGLQGLQGRQGTQGFDGTQGIQGFQGTGTQGPQGATGSGGGGGSLSGTNYIYVAADGTDTQNATELQAAYDAAKLMTPSVTNRITIVCGPGYYNFGTSTFTMDTQYIDLVSLDGNRSVVFNATYNVSVPVEGSISITANDVFVKGVDVQTKAFTIAGLLNLLRVENCKGGDFSFGSGPGVDVPGTFTNCQAGVSSFATAGSASGTFTNCQAGVGSFGYATTASGTFTDCQGGNDSFGGGNTVGSIGSGTFTNCQAGDFSFGSFVASGTFTNCQAGDFSFGYGNTASGTFTECQAGILSFAGSGGTASGTFTGCIGDDRSFGSGSTASLGDGDASGTFTNCQAGDFSFGGNGGTASGIFTYCIGGDGSFGGNDSLTPESGTLSGKLYYCRLTLGTFQSPTVGGKIVLGIDGNDDIINQTA